MASPFFVLVVLISSLCSSALASDSSPLQDFCVADTNGPVLVNGFACKDPKTVQANDFFFSGLHIPGDTSNPVGSRVTPVDVAQIPGSLARVDFAPWGINPPHTHPRAKSKDAPAERPILGRFSSHLKIGIVGLPNVGKSTLFNTLTKLSIPAENFPFCTIEPNEARVNIPDERFEWLCQLFKPKSEVSAFLEIHDIAGLVRGSHEGQGLGNNFLSHIRAVDVIFHVLRAFEDPDIIHVDDLVDPVRDLETISAELRLKDIKFIDRRIDDLEKSMKRSNDKQLIVELELCQRVKASLEEGKDVRLVDWKAADIEILNTFQLLTAKPVVYLVNMNEKDYARKKNKFLPKIHAWVQEHGGETIIPFSCALERNLADLSPEEAAKYCEENKVQSALPKIIKTGFAAINLIYFFTAGPDEVKCWQIRRLSKAPQAAGTIHTDFEKGFICAEVMKFEDLKELGSESAVKASGKYRQEGKTYVVQDGDIIFFKFNVSGGGKK